MVAMPRRPAVITQGDVARVLRAAKQAGCAAVEVTPDGRIIVHISEAPLGSGTPSTCEDEEILFL